MRFVQQTKFTRKYYILNEILNACTHGIGFGLSVAGLVLLLIKGAHQDALHVVSYALYGSMMILLFLFSTLFHSLIFTKAKKVFQVFDHASIFLLIAGSYTPFCLLSVGGLFGWILFGLIWLMALAGIVYKSLTLHKAQHVSKISTIIYVIMGWLCVLAAPQLLHSLGTSGMLLLFFGGVSYTVGAVLYSLKNIRYMHVVWHLFVMLGAALMFFSVLFYT